MKALLWGGRRLDMCVCYMGVGHWIKEKGVWKVEERAGRTYITAKMMYVW